MTRSPFEHANAFPHADQSEAGVINRDRVEADTRIRDLQVDVVPVARDLHGRGSRLTVLGDVVQGFLRDAIEAERHARIDGIRNLGRY